MEKGKNSRHQTRDNPCRVSRWANTQGVGKRGKALTPYAIDPRTDKYLYSYFDVSIDEESLKEIAKNTGGKYFRATNKKKLYNIYDEINQMEKAKISSVEYEVDVPEKSFPLMISALLIILTVFVLKSTLLKSLVWV